MAKWTAGQVIETPRRYHAIHCFTCKKNLPSKSYAKMHRGHDVDYVDKDGKRDD